MTHLLVDIATIHALDVLFVLIPTPESVSAVSLYSLRPSQFFGFTCNSGVVSSDCVHSQLWCASLVTVVCVFGMISAGDFVPSEGNVT